MRIFTTCQLHPACQVETGDNGTQHHPAQQQPLNPTHPQVEPETSTNWKRWVARQRRKWRRRLFD